MAASGSPATEVALTMASLPEGVAFDDSPPDLLGRIEVQRGTHPDANANWTGVDVVVSGGSAFRGIALDAAAGKLYWTSSNLAQGAKIRRANLDGSNIETLVDLGTAGSNPRGIASIPQAGRCTGRTSDSASCGARTSTPGGRVDRLRDRVWHRPRPGRGADLLVELHAGEYLALRARGRRPG